MDYLGWKLLHILSVMLFLGNITTGLFWAAHAHRTRDFRLIGSTFEGIQRSDLWFTVPGIIGILVGGFATAFAGKVPILATGWILWSIVLFLLGAALFGVFVGPTMGQIRRMIGEAEPTEPPWEAYEALYTRWQRWGLVALLLPVLALVIMVLKPSLPGL